jgi:Trypsin-like peptidase domain/TPR repeat
MSLRISQWIGLIGVAATIPLVQTIAVAMNQVEIGQIATSITVLITKANGGNGSGVILQHQGDIYTVLTVAHVVKERVSYQITTPDGRSYDVIPSSIRSASGDVDLAVIKFRSRNTYPIATLGNCNLIKVGMSVYVAGFSGTTLGRTRPVLDFNPGIVSSNSYQAQAKGYSLIYTNTTMPGMSGGTALNSNGELIAIHGVGDKDRDGVRTGFNFAIPINRFGEVASSMGVELNGQVAPIPRDTTKTADDYLRSATLYESPGLFQNYSAALNEYNSAIKLDPNYALAYNKRGNLKLNLKDIQGALADYNQAIILEPDFANPYNNRGIIKQNNYRDIRGALADYDRAIRLDSNLVMSYRNRARLKQDEIKDIQGALSDYNRLIQLDPNYAEDYYNRGYLKEKLLLPDIQGALVDYNQAIILAPKYPIAYYQRGYLKA